MMWSQPCARASAAFSSLPTVPITVAPRWCAHWARIRPTPPAAACSRMVSPRSMRMVCRSSIWAVMPFNIMAAAVRSSMSAGSPTSRSAGMTRSTL